ncbi:MAG: HAMP domain-containing sensor histidine kinase [Bacteroidota bacterium]|nr:HAMP domain-containing sensor histidine kinase [Bacteroidota bacterium]
MKRIFTIITIFITLSLVGIIYFQVSWLRNMILLRQDQIKEKIYDATKIVGKELEQYKGSYSLGPGSKSQAENIFSDDFSLELLKPPTIGRRFNTAELNEKIRNAFSQMGLEKMKFEFGLILGDPRTNQVAKIERHTDNFGKSYDDSANNYSQAYILITPSGSAAENLAMDETLFIVALDWKDFAFQSLRWNITLIILFTIIIITAFYLTVRTILRQKKLGDIKNDFINNMTHEFKTPIATISLAVDAMKNEKVIQNRDKISYFSKIIKEENQRMNRQVETILKASQLERQEVELNLKPVHVHEIIKDVADNFSLQLEEKNGKAELLLNAENDLVEADEVHFSNLVNNLVDNAIKYAKENTPVFVKITTQVDGKNLMIKVEDNGIGMNKETLKRVFEKFYRAHTGNIHNVKGFGLGLSYVKTIIEGHHGTVKADSTLGKGSQFTIELPLKK